MEYVLVLISLIGNPEMIVEGTYPGYVECFEAREEYIPEIPHPGTQGVCIRVIVGEEI